MNTHEYTARIAQCLEDNPVLGTCLQRVVTAWRRRNPGSHPLQVTLCDTREVTLFELVRLFSPDAIKTRRNKYVFLPEKMTGSGINLDEWLHAAAAILGDEPEKSSESNNAADMLCGRLSMLFPALDVALDTLRQQAGNVKRKITEVGFDRAMQHYQHCLTATQFLKTNTRTLSASDLGVRVCNNSKAFRPGTACHHTAVQLLAAEIGCDTQEAMTICGVIDNPTAAIVTVFGPFIYYRHNQPFRWIKQLWETGEAATLNFGNPDFPFRHELEFTIEHGWLEQESWLAP